MPPPPQGPVQMAVGPGLLCKAGSPKAGQQRNNKMDSLLLKTRKLATSHGCQSLQPIEGRQHQAHATLSLSQVSPAEAPASVPPSRGARAPGPTCSLLLCKRHSGKQICRDTARRASLWPESGGPRRAGGGF
ncbi:uncharacterized protein LOC141577079 isoform X2 [Camelus bactrianus]|uniref:Uncharacterized protein LOC141577079 isoform X2 n=1 Tax=Camelus bactrianus TaxID=9837 RepID=A0AC58Q385_CAMBA